MFGFVIDNASEILSGVGTLLGWLGISYFKKKRKEKKATKPTTTK